MSNLLLTVKKQDLGVRICDSCVLRSIYLPDKTGLISANTDPPGQVRSRRSRSFHRFALFKALRRFKVQMDEGWE
jgi:hypothetical protein